MTDTIWDVGGGGRGACQEEQQGGRLALTEVVGARARQEQESRVGRVGGVVSAHPQGNAKQLSLQGGFGRQVWGTW